VGDKHKYIFKCKCLVKIKKGEPISFKEKSKSINVFRNFGIQDINGFAIRDLTEGEIVEFNRYINTKDFVVKGEEYEDLQKSLRDSERNTKKLIRNGSRG